MKNIQSDEISKVFIIPIPGTNYKAVERTFIKIGCPLATRHDLDARTLLVVPGVSTVQSSMQFLHASDYKGLILTHHDNNGHILGICSGMQLLCKYSEEQNATGLGIIDADIRRLRSDKLLTPNIGWHRCSDAWHFYFMHSYYFPVKLYDDVLDKSLVIDTDPSVLAFGRVKNVYLCQFHPEKSGQYGLNFLKGILSCE